MKGSSRRMLSSVVLMAIVAAAMIAAVSSEETVAAAAAAAAADDDCSLSKEMLTKCVGLNNAQLNDTDPSPFAECCSELNKNCGKCRCDIISAIEKEIGFPIFRGFCLMEREVTTCTCRTCSFSADQMKKKANDCLMSTSSSESTRCCTVAGSFGPGCFCEFEKIVVAEGSSRFNTEFSCTGGCSN